MVPLESLVTVSYAHCIATIAVSLAVSTQYTNVTGRQPARQTRARGIGSDYAQHHEAKPLKKTLHVLVAAERQCDDRRGRRGVTIYQTASPKWRDGVVISDFLLVLDFKVMDN